MKFIALAEVVSSIAETIELSPHLDQLGTFADKAFQTAVNSFWEVSNPRIEWARASSLAALQLNEALHHGDGPPRWMEYDEAKRFAVENKVIGLEAIDILTRTTGRGSELLNRCSTHIRNASVGCRVDLLDADFSRTQSNEVAPLRPLRIGFDLAEIVPFLYANGIAHDLGGLTQAAPAQTAGTVPAPVGKVPASEPKEKRRTLWDVVTPYIIEIIQAGQYANAKQLFNALESKAGQGSPFDKGTGSNRGSLFAREISKSLALKTLQTNWPKLKAAAKK